MKDKHIDETGWHENLSRSEASIGLKNEKSEHV